MSPPPFITRVLKIAPNEIVLDVTSPDEHGTDDGYCKMQLDGIVEYKHPVSVIEGDEEYPQCSHTATIYTSDEKKSFTPAELRKIVTRLQGVAYDECKPDLEAIAHTLPQKAEKKWMEIVRSEGDTHRVTGIAPG